MANLSISQLPEAGDVIGADLLAIVQDNVTKKIGFNALKDEVNEDVEAEIDALKDETVQTDTKLGTDNTDSTVTIVKTKKKLGDASGTDTSIPLPVASESNAGVMNPQMYINLQNLAEQVASILTAAVAITGITKNPSQDALTQAWKDKTSKTDLLNGATIYDVDNSMIWTYYSNTSTWYGHPASQSEVSVSLATNSTPGIVEGTPATGAGGTIFVETSGKMSVNKWDEETAKIANNASKISALDTNKQDKLTFDASPKSTSNNPVTSGGLYTEFGKVAYIGEEITNGKFVVPSVS